MDVVYKHNPSKQHTKGRNNRITVVRYFRAPCKLKKELNKELCVYATTTKRTTHVCSACTRRRKILSKIRQESSYTHVHEETHEKPVVKRVFVFFVASFFFNSQCAAAVVCGAVFVSFRLLHYMVEAWLWHRRTTSRVRNISV